MMVLILLRSRLQRSLMMLLLFALATAAATVVLVLPSVAGKAIDKNSGISSQSFHMDAIPGTATTGAPPALGERKVLRHERLHADAPRLLEEYEQLQSSEHRERVRRTLQERNIPLADAESLHVGSKGLLFYADTFPFPSPTSPSTDAVDSINDSEAMPSAPSEDGQRRNTSPEDAAESFAAIRERRESYESAPFFIDQSPTGFSDQGLPFYHSRPQAKTVIYLDFDGHENPLGSAWGRFSAYPFNLNGDFSLFSQQEIEAIRQIWAIVAEDYAPFDVDVTTEAPFSSHPRPRIAHALITSNIQNTPGAELMPYGQNGGASYTGIFLRADIEFFSPSLIYVEPLNRYPPYIAVVVAHEVGHIFGLSHDGSTDEVYHRGFDGTTPYNSWGPIMGAPYGRALTVWSNGEYAYANNFEDDVRILRRQLGSACNPARYHNSQETARPVSFPDGPFTYAFNGKGIICNRGHRHWWVLTAVSDAIISVSARPFRSRFPSRDGNLDISLAIYGPELRLYARSRPSGVSTASLEDVAVDAGRVFIVVDGVGDPEVVASDYGSLGQYFFEGSMDVPSQDTPPYTLPETTTVPLPTTSPHADCEEDRFGVHDSVDTAVNLTSFLGDTITGLQLCPLTQDYFTLTVCRGAVITISIRLSDPYDAIKAYLYSTDGTFLANSTANSLLSERIHNYRVTDFSTEFVLLIFGFDGTFGPYDLTTSVSCRDDFTPSTTSFGSTAAQVTTTAAPIPCTNDKFEPNDVLGDATPLSPTLARSGVFVICNGERDVFALALCPSSSLEPAVVTIDLDFIPCLGDLDLFLLDGNGNTLARSTSSASTEHITFSYKIPATYFVRVEGFAGASGQYTLRTSGITCENATSSTTSMPDIDACANDKFEPNDDPADATEIADVRAFSSSATALRICGGTDPINPNTALSRNMTGDVDWFSFRHRLCNGVAADLEVSIAFDSAEGDLDLQLYRASDMVLVAESKGIANTEAIQVRAATPGVYLARISGYFGASAFYRLAVRGSEECRTEACADVLPLTRSQCRRFCPYGFQFYKPANKHPDFAACGTSTHCECLDDSCVGITKGNRRQCRTRCEDVDQAFVYYDDAEDSGRFLGCEAPHCECVPQACAGAFPVADEETCMRSCGGIAFTFTERAHDAGFVGCISHSHCSCG